jgi:hypothetical protein
MDRIFGWEPLLWSVRVLLLLVSCGAGYVFLLYVGRSLRPKHLWKLLTSDLPQFRNVEGTAKLLGQELSLKGEIAGAQGKQLELMEARLAIVERQLLEVGQMLTFAVRPLNRSGE